MSEFLRSFFNHLKRFFHFLDHWLGVLGFLFGAEALNTFFDGRNSLIGFALETENISHECA